MITQGELKEALYYDQNTGIFEWKINKFRIKKGMIAGSLNHDGYYRIRLNYKEYQAHRLAFFYMTGKFPKNEIDHINRIKDDNRWCNLREATKTQNKRNVAAKKNNKLGVKCVYKNHNASTYRVVCTVNGKQTYLGSFKHLNDAKKVYQEFSLKEHKEFSFINC